MYGVCRKVTSRNVFYLNLVGNVEMGRLRHLYLLQAARGIARLIETDFCYSYSNCITANYTIPHSTCDKSQKVLEIAVIFISIVSLSLHDNLTCKTTKLVVNPSKRTSREPTSHNTAEISHSYVT